MQTMDKNLVADSQDAIDESFCATNARRMAAE